MLETDKLDRQNQNDIDIEHLSKVLEAMIFASDKPVSLDFLNETLSEFVGLDKKTLRTAIELVDSRYQDSSVELVQVASGYRFQTRKVFNDYVSRLWDEKPQKYSRALLETLALIAYRQPITRGDIEEIRGVAVSSNIMRTLLEREWVRVIGHREVPGRPAIYGTTKKFLDYFNLNNLSQLPDLSEVRDLDTIGKEISQQLELTEQFESQDDSGENDTSDTEKVSDLLSESGIEPNQEQTAPSDGTLLH